MDADLLKYRIAFSGFRNVNLGTAGQLRSLGITETDFFTLPARRLASISGLRESYFDDERRKQALENAEREVQFVQRNSIGIHYFADPDSGYPARLRDCQDAPAMLFSFGNLAEYAHVVAVVGTRHCTAYGAEFTRKLVSELGECVDDLLIVSGLAFGVDIAAHRAALAADIPTGAVLAHGLNTIYPADHRDDAQRMVRSGGFLLTEYPSVAPIHRGNFLSRNRIVAALADVTVVVESDIKGGAMTTAHIAAAYNREVMALPGRVCDPYSRGCNALIARCEAGMVRDADDVVNAMNWTSRPAAKKQPELHFLSPEQTSIAEFLKSNSDATVNEMCAALNMPYARLSASLFEMEMENIVISVPGGRYVLVNPDV